MAPTSSARRDPAHPLLAGAELAQRARSWNSGTIRGARRRRGRARCRCGSWRPGCRRPRPARWPPPRPRTTSARKPVPAAAGLGELLVAPVAVEADRRAGHEHRRLGVERRPARRRAGRCPWCGSRGSGASARRSSASRRCPRRRGAPRRRGPRGRRRRSRRASMSQRDRARAPPSERTTRTTVVAVGLERRGRARCR